MSQSLVDAESTAWRQGYREEAIKLIIGGEAGSKNSQENEDPMEVVIDDECEEIIDPMTTKSVSVALEKLLKC